MALSHCECEVAFTTAKWEVGSNYLGRMLRDEAKQFSVERRMNEMKAAFCDAIERHS